MAAQILKKGQKPLNVMGGYRYEEDPPSKSAKRKEA